MKGTAGISNGMDAKSRDFLSYTEYVFSAERLRKNCGRLRIGAIGTNSQNVSALLHVHNAGTEC